MAEKPQLKKPPHLSSSPPSYHPFTASLLQHPARTYSHLIGIPTSLKPSPTSVICTPGFSPLEGNDATYSTSDTQLCCCTTEPNYELCCLTTLHLVRIGAAFSVMSSSVPWCNQCSMTALSCPIAHSLPVRHIHVECHAMKFFDHITNKDVCCNSLQQGIISPTNMYAATACNGGV